MNKNINTTILIEFIEKNTIAPTQAICEATDLFDEDNEDDRMIGNVVSMRSENEYEHKRKDGFFGPKELGTASANVVSQNNKHNPYYNQDKGKYRDTSDNKTKKDGEYYDLAEHGIQFEFIKNIPVLRYNDTTDDSIKDVDVSKVNKVLCESKLDGYYNLSWTKDDLVSLKRVKFELVILSNISSKYPASQHDVVPISFTYKSSNEHDRTIPSAFIVGFYENSDDNEKIGDPILYIPKNEYHDNISISIAKTINGMLFIRLINKDTQRGFIMKIDNHIPYQVH